SFFFGEIKRQTELCLLFAIEMKLIWQFPIVLIGSSVRLRFRKTCIAAVTLEQRALNQGLDSLRFFLEISQALCSTGCLFGRKTRIVYRARGWLIDAGCTPACLTSEHA